MANDENKQTIELNDDEVRTVAEILWCVLIGADLHEIELESDVIKDILRELGDEVK